MRHLTRTGPLCCTRCAGGGGVWRQLRVWLLGCGREGREGGHTVEWRLCASAEAVWRWRRRWRGRRVTLHTPQSSWLVGTILSQGKVGWEFARLIFVFAGSRKVVLGQRPAKEEAAAKAAAAKQEAAAKAKEKAAAKAAAAEKEKAESQEKLRAAGRL